MAKKPRQLKPSPKKPSIKQKLKIGLVFDDSLDRPDGVSQFVLSVGHWLSERGHEVHYLVGETSRTDIANLHSLAKNQKVTFNGNVMSVPKPASTVKLKQLLKDVEFDVLHVQVPYSPFLAGKLIKLAPITTAVVGTFHILPYSKMVVLGNRILANINRRTGRRFDAMTAVSPPAKDFAKKLYNYDCQIVPNPIALSLFPPELKTSSKLPRIVFLGRLVPRKGAQKLLEAIVRLKQLRLTETQFEVIIGGKGHMMDELRGYAERNNLSQLVSFPGFVAEDEKAALLASADIAIFPSISGESFGISLLEAMSAARGIVLAGNNPGYSSVMHGLKNHLFDPNDVDGLAHTLADWLDDPAGRQDAAKHQQQYVKQYDIEIVGQALETIYAQALQTRRQM